MIERSSSIAASTVYHAKGWVDGNTVDRADSRRVGCLLMSSLAAWEGEFREGETGT